MDRFEDQLKSTSREMDMFMKKDPPVLTMDEMRGSVQVIDKLDARAKQVSTLNNDQKQPTQLTKNYCFIKLSLHCELHHIPNKATSPSNKLVCKILVYRFNTNVDYISTAPCIISLSVVILYAG